MPISTSTEPSTVPRGRKRKAGDVQAPASKTTVWRHARGRPSQKDKAAKQQYLTSCEEKALLEYVLRMSERGYPLPVKFLRSLAVVIARQRDTTFMNYGTDDTVRPPGKNWPQAFYGRHPELKARRVKALDWARSDGSIRDKIVHWFTLIGKEVNDPAIVPENVYNMDETGVLLSVLSTLKVLARLPSTCSTYFYI